LPIFFKFKDWLTDNLQAWVTFIQGEDDSGRRLVVLPAFETLPHKSKANAAEDALTHKVADFAVTADKQALKVHCTLLPALNEPVNCDACQSHT
jgi:hypothetical protein